MSYAGLLEFLTALQDEKALAAWELESVTQIGVDDTGSTCFAVTISLGALVYRLTSYMPPLMVRREILARMRAIEQKG